ncbi:MAG: hypothetical protein LIO53_08625 [Oscillospiraceae bacterium]|nr:hypothetical protein [Oscillospiraceae bacterium]
MKNRIIALLCAIMIIPSICVAAKYEEDDLQEIIEDAIEWKDENDNPFYSIGTNSSNLYIIALNRMGNSCDYASYLSGLDGIAAGYGAEHNASDMQRTAIAVVASGGDPRNVGGRDLIADGVYYRDAVSPIDKEGVNGYSWALIALDAGDYDIPDWALKNRNDIISGILSHQNTNGSFDDDAYATAAAVTALAPYYYTSGAYTITRSETGQTLDLSPRDAVDKAIEYLSDSQTKDGDWGDLNSTAMTVIALSTMGINADGDDRFTAKKGTALDGLMMYKESDGGFSADLRNSDGEATSIALCAVVSHLRNSQGKAAIFNFRIGDTITFKTPVPAATAKASGSSSSSSATTKPKATAKASATVKPTATVKPLNTVQPKKTTAPKPSASPTPKPTKRPALVGPVEMPGPMPSPEPTAEPEKENANSSSKSNGAASASGIIAVLALCAVILIMYMKNNDKLSGLAKLLGLKKPVEDKPYKAKRHRKTEEHRRFETRQRYKNRRKYNNRRR